MNSCINGHKYVVKLLIIIEAELKTLILMLKTYVDGLHL